MASHIEQIKVIIEAETAYTASAFPDTDNSKDILITYNSGGNSMAQNENEIFSLKLEATSVALLETMITALLDTNSDRASGYDFSTTGYPFFLKTKMIKKHVLESDAMAWMTLEAIW